MTMADARRNSGVQPGSVDGATRMSPCRKCAASVGVCTMRAAPLRRPGETEMPLHAPVSGSQARACAATARRPFRLLCDEIREVSASPPLAAFGAVPGEFARAGTVPVASQPA